MSNFKILGINILIVMIVALAVFGYAKEQQVASQSNSVHAFEYSTSSLESSVRNYLVDVQRTCDSWANYINASSLTMQQAIHFVKAAKTNAALSGQIIWNDTLKGIATESTGNNDNFYEVDYSDSLAYLFANKHDEDTEIHITPKYIDPISGKSAVTFYQSITLLDEEGNKKDAYLLRVLPITYLEERWDFSTGYEDTQVALIDMQGDYLIQPSVLAGNNLFTHLEKYNRDDIDIEALRNEIQQNDSGSFSALNANNESRFLSYIHIENNADWIIIVSIGYGELYGNGIDWTIPILILFALFLVVVTDVAFFIRLRDDDLAMQEKLSGQLETITQQETLLKDALKIAEKASVAKSDFLANMSHDIRTPMNGIIGMTAIAATHIDDKERVQDCLEKITVASKHLLGLINEVLDMSKIESGKVDLNESYFELSKLVDNLLTVINPQIKEHNHQLSVTVSGVEHEKVIGDNLRIQQVFINLISNSVKYTPDGGRIKIFITEKPSHQAKVGCFEFVFEDNGIGMTEEYLKDIFEPFTRAEDSRTSKIQGTGLGMPIARNIVRMMGGDIKVESKLNEGTRFTVVMYLKLQEDENTSHESFVDLPVLVADDDETSCQYTCELLESIGMKSTGVYTGQQACDLVVEAYENKQNYFAVILDWKMADMDGVETARRIRRVVGEGVPIIIISAYDWSEIEQEARLAGVDAFVSKPLFKSRLVYLLDEIVGAGNQEKDIEMPLTDFEKMDLTGCRVLLAEDNDFNAEIATEILKMTGLEVDWVEDGEQAVNKIKESSEWYYDCILMDVQMPKMNGYEATRAIRKLESSYAKEVPIIAMTANAFVEDVQAARDSGMNDHIAKPIDMKALAGALNKWVAARKYNMNKTK